MQMKNISIVIPLFNEAESLPELYEWIVKVADEHQLTYEIIFVDDGSKDGSWEVISQIADKDENVKGIKFQRNYGKSPALHSGFEIVDGEVVITMDADLQDSPEEIPGLYTMIKEEGYDLVSGWKKKRHDPISKTIPTKLFNRATRIVSGIKLHDFNCGLKAYKYQVVKSIEVYGEMHRYMPLLAKSAGFNKIGERVVQHQARKYGKSKFGMSRFINGFLDLGTVAFLNKFSKKPMHFFGTWGTLMFILGFFLVVWMGINKLFIDTTGRLITSRPEFYIALTTMILGTQLFLAGFLGELIGRSASNRNNYLIEKRINHPS